MKIQSKIALTCFLLIGCGFFLMGIIYTFSPTPMPYHIDAMGIEWDQLPTGQQLVILAILTGSGSGMMVSGLSIFLISFFPFRRGENWARWSLLALSLMESIPTLYSVFTIKKYTPGNPPLFLIVLVVILAFMGFFLGRNNLNEKKENNSTL